MHSRTLTAMLMAVSLVGTACGSGDSSETSNPGTTGASATTSTTVATPTEPAVVLGSGNFNSSATELTGQFEPVTEGTYRVETNAFPFSFTVNGEWFVQPNAPGFTVLTDPNSFGPGDRDVVFIRPAALSDPANPTLPTKEQQLWPVNDLAGWLANLDDRIVTTPPQPVSLGGREAQRFDVSLPSDYPCGPEFCALFAEARANLKAFEPRYDFRVWWVDGGDYEPLAVVVGSGPEGSDFFATAESLLATVAFGEPGPHPVPEGDLWTCGFNSEVPAGAADLPTAGGLRLTLPAERFVAQRNGLTLIFGPFDGLIDFTIVEETPDGAPIETVDDVVVALEVAGMIVTEVSGAAMLGQPARVFDVAADTGATDNLAFIPSWFVPNLGRLWIAETERGVFLVGAETQRTQAQLDGVIAEAEAMLPTLEFIDPPCPAGS